MGLPTGEIGERLRKTSVIDNKRTYLPEMPSVTPYDVAQIEVFIAAHKVNVVAMVHHGTCSGMLNPLAQIGALVKMNGALFVVDGVSSVGAEVIDMEACHIAFVSSSNSKAIGSYPGLYFVIGRKKHLKRLKRRVGETTYLNLAIFCAFLRNHCQPPNTPAVPLFFCVGTSANRYFARGRHQEVCAHQGKCCSASRWHASAQLRLCDRRRGNVFDFDNCSDAADTNSARTAAGETIFIYEGKGCFAGKVFQVEISVNCPTTTSGFFLPRSRMCS
jgi:2-aminoethylphosphonate-pyruvate transaminase